MVSLTKKSLRVSLLLFFSLLILVGGGSVCAEEKLPDESASEIYHTEQDKGYYNYEVIPETPEEEEDPEKPAIQQVQPPPKYSYDELWNMHPDVFQAHVKEVTKWAVQTPTEENVVHYLMVQDVARRKSAAFASVVSMVGQKNPQFSVDGVYPSTTPGRMAVVENRIDEIDTVIKQARDEFALIMFTQNGCRFCTAQRSILTYFENNYQWPIRSVDIYKNPNMASEFGVDQTPAIIIVQGTTGKAMPISSGVTAMADLRTRIYRTVRLMKGEIQPEQWSMFQYEKKSGNDPLHFVKSKGGNQ